MTTGYLWDRAYLGHNTSPAHPERPERADVLATTAMLTDVPGIRAIQADPYLGRPSVLKVHDVDYVTMVSGAHEGGRHFLDGGDTVVRHDTYDTALLSAAGAVTATRAVARGEVTNAFAAIRPPGHHAGVGNARGFCVFNNVAVAARFAQSVCGLQRVLIVDWDVHPADGTQAIFYEDPDVHVFSVHQHGIFTERVGRTEHKGRGEGVGATYNLPLPEGASTAEYLRRMEPLLEHAAERCKPDIVFVSCGFDAHMADPVGQMGVDDDGFRRFTHIVGRIAKQHCDGRLVSVLEGGYNPSVLKRCVRHHVEELTVL